ncbi:MAG: DNA-directed RNA polymerase subunit omega [Candidatus Omnitrophica bacterium]|nr:DNA-directed RNA polymerase subunit omega [Candidatus Omnitrophota bacterium]
MLATSGGSVFRLTRLAMNRALELASGMPALIKHHPSANLTTIALEEIAQGKVVHKDSSNENLKK